MFLPFHRERFRTEAQMVKSKPNSKPKQFHRLDVVSYLFIQFLHCLPRGRHSEAAHEKRLLCAQKCTRGGVGWGGWVMKGWGGVGHEGVGWVM